MTDLSLVLASQEESQLVDYSILQSILQTLSAMNSEIEDLKALAGEAASSSSLIQVQSSVSHLESLLTSMTDATGLNLESLQKQVEDLKALAGESATAAALIQVQSSVLQLESLLTSMTTATGSGLEGIQKQVEELQGSFASLSQVAKMDATKLEEKIDELSSTLISVQVSTSAVQSSLMDRLSDVIGGDLLLPDDTASDISAAELNAAAEGTFTRELTITLKNANGDFQSLVNFAPVVTSSKGTVADGDVGDPVVTWTNDVEEEGFDPRFLQGLLRLTVTFDTDAGATKTYVSGEALTVTVSVSSAILLANVTDFVHTFNVVA